MQEEDLLVPTEIVFGKKMLCTVQAAKRGEKAVGNRCLHHQRSKESSKVPFCCLHCKGSL